MIFSLNYCSEDNADIYSRHAEKMHLAMLLVTFVGMVQVHQVTPNPHRLCDTRTWRPPLPSIWSNYSELRNMQKHYPIWILHKGFRLQWSLLKASTELVSSDRWLDCQAILSWHQIWQKRMILWRCRRLPRYDTEGARFAYRAFLQIAQVVPNNWRFFLPGAGGISQDVIAIAGMGAVPIAILAGGGPYANVADPYSALMRQRWASNGVVAFGKNVADVLPNLRMIVSQTVEGTRSFNVAGYQLEVNPEAKLIGTPEEKQEWRFWDPLLEEVQIDRHLARFRKCLTVEELRQKYGDPFDIRLKADAWIRHHPSETGLDAYLHAFALHAKGAVTYDEIIALQDAICPEFQIDTVWTLHHLSRLCFTQIWRSHVSQTSGMMYKTKTIKRWKNLKNQKNMKNLKTKNCKMKNKHKHDFVFSDEAAGLESKLDEDVASSADLYEQNAEAEKQSEISNTSALSSKERKKMNFKLRRKDMLRKKRLVEEDEDRVTADTTASSISESSGSVAGDDTQTLLEIVEKEAQHHAVCYGNYYPDMCEWREGEISEKVVSGRRTMPQALPPEIENAINFDRCTQKSAESWFLLSLCRGQGWSSKSECINRYLHSLNQTLWNFLLKTAFTRLRSSEESTRGGSEIFSSVEILIRKFLWHKLCVFISVKSLIGLYIPATTARGVSSLDEWRVRMQPRQIIATSHDPGPQKVAEEGKSPYFMLVKWQRIKLGWIPASTTWDYTWLYYYTALRIQEDVPKNGRK